MPHETVAFLFFNRLHTLFRFAMKYTNYQVAPGLNQYGNLVGKHTQYYFKGLHFLVFRTNDFISNSSDSKLVKSLNIKIPAVGGEERISIGAEEQHFKNLTRRNGLMQELIFSLILVPICICIDLIFGLLYRYSNGRSARSLSAASENNLAKRCQIHPRQQI